MPTPALGIREEDLPRVFEKGFTGYNGRWDRKVHGHRAVSLPVESMDRLDHAHYTDLRSRQGTMVRLDLIRGDGWRSNLTKL